MSAREALRSGTAAAHDRVDALFSRFDLADPGSYRRFLSAQAEAFLPVEAAIEAAGAESLLPDWPDRRRSRLLAADLKVLGSPLPGAAAAPLSAEPAVLLGAIYVLEGSRLGGGLLRRKVPDHLPRAFLDAVHPPGSWRKLLDKLEATLYAPESRQAAVRSATEVFERFEAAARHYLEIDKGE